MLASRMVPGRLGVKFISFERIPRNCPPISTPWRMDINGGALLLSFDHSFHRPARFDEVVRINEF
jgi:hypothetical protein